jgi:Domain of unknown function (DUF5753)
METGHGIATPRDIRDLCEFYDVTDHAEREHLMLLAREGKQTGWWQGYDLDYFATYVGLEAEAAGIKSYQSAIVPGLLQTPGYARAMHGASVPKISPERVDQLIEVRLIRQQLLMQKAPLRFEVVLDEAVLHRAVGGPTVMRAQLDRLIEMSNRPNVTMQIIPYSVGAHPAMDSTFNILEFTGSVPSVVYVEGLVGWIYLERPQDIDRYQQVFEYLRTVASSPQESIELLARVGGEYNNPVTFAAPGEGRI